MVRQKSSVDVIQRTWFSVSSRKSSTAAEVQSYLSAFETIHLPLLFAIVNLADADVCILYLLFISVCQSLKYDNAFSCTTYYHLVIYFE